VSDLAFPWAALPPALADRWFRAALVALGLVLLAGAALLLKRRPGWARGLGAPGVCLLLLGAGGLALDQGGLAFWLLAGAGGLYLVMLVGLLISGVWSRTAALVLLVPALVGLGGWWLRGSEEVASEVALALVGMRLKNPWWLLVWLVLPLVVLLAFPRLFRGEVRPWVTLGLRCAGVALLGLALCEPYLTRASKTVTVLFVLDRSLSIPVEEVDDPAQPGAKTDLRWARLRQFINDAVEKRGPGRERDKAGLIVFARRPRLELPPSDAPRFNLQGPAPAIEDGNYTDIAAALKLALASFPEGTGKRIVLLSDGNENLGSAEEVARLAQTLGVQIDTVPLAAGQRNEDEVLVERVDAPPVIEQGARVPIRVLVRSHNPNTVVGTLTLRQITDKEGRIILRPGGDGSIGIEVEPLVGTAKGVRITRVQPRSPAGRAGLEAGEEVFQVNGVEVANPIAYALELGKAKPGAPLELSIRRNPIKVVAVRQGAQLRLGLNPFSFDRPLTDEQRSYTYEAEFEPKGLLDAKGKPILDEKGKPRLLTRDRVQNNKASTHVVARGQGRVLLLEDKSGEHKELVDRLVEAGRGRFKVVAEPVDILDNYKEKEKLAVFLSNFDCVILANVPAERISEVHQEAIRANTHDQGCGLVMIGGQQSFGAGGWQTTPVEQALPVDCDIKSLKVQGKGGLVLIMHACEMADGNRWERKIARLAVDRLGPTDEIGVLDWGFTGFKWHIPMQEVGPNRKQIITRIDSMVPSDMPDFDPALKMAHAALSNPKKDFGAKHVIIISDGDPQQQDKRLLKQMKAAKITIATVGVATHGAPQDKALEAIATTPKRYHKVTDPSKLPAIYIKETRLVSQAFVYRKEFQPLLIRSGPTTKLPDLLPLGGFVRSTPKPSLLVEQLILTPKFAGQDFPILATWNYGLGKAVAFTSDAGKPEFWSRKWLEGAGGEGLFAGFWEQVIGWALRPVESGRLQMHTEYRDGKIKVVVEARTEDGKPDTNLRLRAGLTSPAGGGRPGGKQQLRFNQKNSGLYEAEVKAEEAGSYFITAQATRVRKIKKPGEPQREVEEGTDSVRAGVTLPYSPEFADLESNTPLLDRLREMTGGQSYAEDADSLGDAAESGAVFRPVVERIKSLLPFHYWLLFLAASLLWFDVAVRRLALDPEQVSEQSNYWWARLRGRPVPPPGHLASVERLQARPPAVAAPAGGRAARRFEGPGGLDVAIVDASAPVQPGPPKPPPSASGTLAPDQPEAKPGDAMDRLLQTKKKARDEMDKGGG
jgi:Mg-chelatase subunit ChlD